MRSPNRFAVLATIAVLSSTLPLEANAVGGLCEQAFFSASQLVRSVEVIKGISHRYEGGQILHRVDWAELDLLTQKGSARLRGNVAREYAGPSSQHAQAAASLLAPTLASFFRTHSIARNHEQNSIAGDDRRIVDSIISGRFIDRYGNAYLPMIDTPAMPGAVPVSYGNLRNRAEKAYDHPDVVRAKAAWDAATAQYEASVRAHEPNEVQVAKWAPTRETFEAHSAALAAARKQELGAYYDAFSSTLTPVPSKLYETMLTPDPVGEHHAHQNYSNFLHRYDDLERPAQQGLPSPLRLPRAEVDFAPHAYALMTEAVRTPWLSRPGAVRGRIAKFDEMLSGLLADPTQFYAVFALENNLFQWSPGMSHLRSLLLKQVAQIDPDILVQLRLMVVFANQAVRGTTAGASIGRDVMRLLQVANGLPPTAQYSGPATYTASTATIDFIVAHRHTPDSPYTPRQLTVRYERTDGGPQQPRAAIYPEDLQREQQRREDPRFRERVWRSSVN